MNIGIGLPNTIPGTDGHTMVEWARRAEEAGFAGLATIDRIAYPSYESLIALAAAAGATERIGLFTNVLLAPTRDPVMLAKESASVHQLSGGRLVLGLGVGGRADDFEATGRSMADRGTRFDDLLELLHEAWAGRPVAGSPQPVCPEPEGRRIPVMIGGQPHLAVSRAVRWDAGWTIGGAPPEMAAPGIEALRAGWMDAGGQGEPRIAALSYFSLGEEVVDAGVATLRHYYGFLGPMGEAIATSAPRTPQAVRDRMKAFADLGVDELYLDPTVAEVSQVDRLAEVVL